MNNKLYLKEQCFVIGADRFLPGVNDLDRDVACASAGPANTDVEIKWEPETAGKIEWHQTGFARVFCDS